jgi:hypothetical protein
MKFRALNDLIVQLWKTRSKRAVQSGSNAFHMLIILLLKMERQNLVLARDYYDLTARFLAYAFGADLAAVAQFNMDDAPFSGRHRLQRLAAAG